MGGFYGSVQLRGDDQHAVRGVLEKLARKGGRFLLGPPLGGWIGVYPDNGGQDASVARELARKIPGELFHLVVHDDDLFAYEYYRDGKRVDRYNSAPDYFEEVDGRERRALRGKPATFAHLSADPERFGALRDRLAGPADDVVFASELLVEFADALGIRNALTSYEYLRENQAADGIEGRDRFVHVPEPARELADRQHAEAALRGESARLAGAGLLLAEAVGRAGHALQTPQWCPSPDGQGFLVTWSSPIPGPGELRPLERYGPPWTAGPRPAGPSLDPRLFTIEASPSGRYLAVGQAAGGPSAALWDLREGRRVAESPQAGVVAWVGFTRGESAMVSVSSGGEQGQAVVMPLGGGDARAIPLKYPKLAAVHPAGDTLAVVDHRDRLLVVDLASGAVERTLFVGGRQDPIGPLPTMMEQVRAEASKMDPGAMERAIRKQQEQVLRALEKSGLPPQAGSFEQLRERMAAQMEEQIRRIHGQFAQLGTPEWQAEQVRGAELVFRLKFDPAGERLLAATSRGVRVYAWRDVLEAEGDTPPPARAVDMGPTAGQATPGGHVYDLDHDPGRGLLVFGSLDGLVRYLDLADGRSGVLLELPGRPAILRLGLSRDRSALALTCHPDMFAPGSKRRGPLVQFWDYPALCRRL